jgi:hypothetical protein
MRATLSTNERNALLERWLAEAVEPAGLQFGGGGTGQVWSGYLEPVFGLTIFDQQRQQVIAWLASQGEIEHFDIGPIEDDLVLPDGISEILPDPELLVEILSGAFILDTVTLETRADDHLTFHVHDPSIDSGRADLDLTFIRLAHYEGPEEMHDVRLRCISPPDAFDPATCDGFEFTSEDIVPTEGRPYLAEILTDGTSRVLFGTTVTTREALVVAQFIIAGECRHGR